jgi:TonB family protein
MSAARWLPLAGLALALACTTPTQPTPTREHEREATKAHAKVVPQPSPAEIEAATQNRQLGPAPTDAGQTRADRREAVLALLTDGTTAKHLGVEAVDDGDEFRPDAGERFDAAGLRPHIVHAGSVVTGPGSFDRGALRRLVGQQQRELRDCYEAARTRDALLTRRLSLHFEISADGTVRDPSLAQPPADHDELDRCALAAVSKWSFPAPEGGPVQVVYSLVLRPR